MGCTKGIHEVVAFTADGQLLPVTVSRNVKILFSLF